MVETRETRPVINRFRDQFWPLSNFYGCEIKFNGMTYKNAEACFQAMKCKTDEEKIQFTLLNGANAKKLGRQIKTDIKEWDAVKDYIMLAIIQAKFLQCEEFRNTLMSTGDAVLIEGNDHGDKYWGVCNISAEGLNKLGTVLMLVRDRELNRKFHAGEGLHYIRPISTPIDTLVTRVKAGYYRYEPSSELNMGIAPLLLDKNVSEMFTIVIVMEPEFASGFTVVHGADIIAVALKVGSKFGESDIGNVTVLQTTRNAYDHFIDLGVKF